MGEQRMKQDARYIPLFKYFEKVFGLNLFRARVPAFENGLIIGDTFISPEQAKRLFATAFIAEAPPVSAARVPELTAPEPNPPQEPPVKPKRGQVQNKEDPAFDI